MNAPSPFHTALAVGNNIAAGVKSYQDRTAIDEILDQASKTGNPEDVDYAMTQILSRVSPEKQQIALAILQKKKGEIEAKNEKLKIKSAYKSQGIPDYVADLDPASQKEFFKQKAEQDKRNKKSTAYQQANLPGYYADLDPLTQRTLIQNQQESSLFNQIFGNNSQIAPSQGFPQKSSQGSPNENPQMEVIDGVPSVWVSQEEANATDQEQGLPQSESAPMDMTQTLNGFSPSPQPQQSVGMEGFSDQQLVAMTGLKGAYGQMAKAELQRRQEAEKINQKKSLENERQIDRSYETNKNFIDNTTKQYRGWETEMKPRLLQMQSIPADEIIKPTAAKFLESLGIPLGALENPSSELYNKLSQDLLKGLPDTYGSRILKVEVDNFLKTIPTLSNSPDGRRMIASNMLKLGQMKEVFYNEMRRQQMDNLDNGKKFPKDFEQRVFDNVKPVIDKLNNQFIKLAAIKSIPEGTIPFFNPQGEVSFVPNDPRAIKWAEQNGGERIW
jgi:hypothetical protein